MTDAEAHPSPDFIEPKNKRVLVVGAGVIGLTTAIRLQECGYEVEVWAEKFSPHTTSDGAAAVWGPYHVKPPEKVLTWGRHAYTVFESHLLIPEAGVFKTVVRQKWREPATVPLWAQSAHDFHLNADGSGFSYHSYVADMRHYMLWLMGRFSSAGGKSKLTRISDFNDAANNFDAVINCAGLGNADLIKNDPVYPIRGVVVEMTPRVIDEVRIDGQNPKGDTYVIPRQNSVICGGCAIEHDGTLTEYPDEAAGILARCMELAPELKDGRQMRVWVGLRPGRPEVRLELGKLNHNKPIIHNYGHGGAGMTLSWGCAEDVVKMLAQAILKHPLAS